MGSKPVGKGAHRGRRLTPEIWAELVEAFRAAPGNAGVAGRIVGVDRRTAAKAWEVGLPYAFSKTPIRQLVDHHHQEKRASREAEHGGSPAGTSSGELARADARGTMAEETRIVQLARRRTLELLDLCGDLSKAAAALAARASSQIRTDLEDAKARVDVPEAVAIIRQIAQTQRSVATSAGLCLEMERLLLGDPGDAEASEEDLTEEEAIAELAAGAEVLDRARARGLVAELAGEQRPTTDAP